MPGSCFIKAPGQLPKLPLEALLLALVVQALSFTLLFQVKQLVVQALPLSFPGILRLRGLLHTP